MARSITQQPIGSLRTTSPQSTLKLAQWQLRQTWRLLLVTGLGVLLAVTLVCSIPLYSRIATTAELRGFLDTIPTTSTIGNSEIQVDSSSSLIDTSAISGIKKQLDQVVQSNLGSYVHDPAQFSAQYQFKLGIPAPSYVDNELATVGSDMVMARSHIQLVAGRLPQALSDTLEIALPADTAQSLHLQVGSSIPISTAYTHNGNTLQKKLAISVVGIFKLAQADDPFWHKEDFHTTTEEGKLIVNTYKALLSNDTFLAFMKNTFDPNSNAQNFLTILPKLDWYYHLDTSRIDTSNIDTVAAGISNVLGSITNGPTNPPFVTGTQSFSPASAALSSFSSRIAVVQIPVVSLSLMVLALMLFFVSMMIDILVERQINAIAVMRSRGASRNQIITSLTMQSTGLGLLGLIAGPFLAIALVQFIVSTSLAATHQNALNIIRGNPGPVFQELLYYALGTVVILLITMAIAIRRAAKLDVVMLRREAGRSTHRPIWQRIGVDMIAALIALLGYAASVYITNPGVLDVQVRALIVPPVTLLEVVFLLIAATLLFLRFFPALLHLLATLVARGPGATPTLALAQMARAPQQAIRMTMLLAFAFFTLSFTASQAQRSTDVGNYEVGADFSAYISTLSRSDTSATYARIPGVLSASVGYRAAPRVIQSVQSGVDMTFELMAVDANTFAQTAIWNEQDSSQPLSSLLKHLLAERNNTLTNLNITTTVPVIVDEAAVKSLDLSVGSHFTIADAFNNPLDCVVVDIVHRLPSILPGGNNYGDVLVDYLTYAKLSAQVNSAFIPTNSVWLRTRDDAKSIASVGKALTDVNLTLMSINDRRAITRNLNSDPLTASLIMILLIGAITAMALALVGNLIASWISVRSRLTSFVVLRALGTAPPQIARVITLEQSIIYITSFVLGTIFGFVLTVLAVPALVFTNVAISGLTSDLSSQDFYYLQNVPPPQVVFPLSLLIALGFLVLICGIALGLMMYLSGFASIDKPDTALE